MAKKIAKNRKEVSFTILPDGTTKGKTRLWEFIEKQIKAKDLTLKKVKKQIWAILNKSGYGPVLYAEERVDYFPDKAETLRGKEIDELARILRCDRKELDPIIQESREQIKEQLKKIGWDPQVERMRGWLGV